QKAEVIQAYGGGSGDILLHGLRCKGSVPRLRDCSWQEQEKVDDIIRHHADFCTHTYDVGVDCG
ncbi:hypothetical protein BaRGS_00030064, partial [Batillaria attramentaria]